MYSKILSPNGNHTHRVSSNKITDRNLCILYHTLRGQILPIVFHEISLPTLFHFVITFLVNINSLSQSSRYT